MGLIVQKFGGSSVANAERVMNVAKIVTDTYREGNDVVVVVSAQGDTTDDLIEKAYEITDNPNLQYEMGSKWNGMKMMLNNHNLDLSNTKKARRNELHQKYNYSAWWSLIMPISSVDIYGYPFPFFIKFDDIEYGLRRRGELIQFSNDFNVRHESFKNKYSPYLEYYLLRNSFITNALHFKLCGLYSFIRFKWKILKYLFKGKADAMKMIILGASDYLKGTEPFFKNDMEQYNSEIKLIASQTKNSFFSCLKYFFKSIGMSFKILFCYGRAKKQFKADYKKLTSLEYWKKVLELHEN